MRHPYQYPEDRPLLRMATLCLGLAAAGGAWPDSSPWTSPSVSAVDAARLLEQSSFGATPVDIERVRSLGVQGYIDYQLKLPPTQFTGFVYVPPTAPADCMYHPATPTDASSLCSRDNYSAFQVQRQFFENAVNAPDQLRQRVAFALSQIFVVSSVQIYEAYGVAAYENLLLRDALGNYRQLLQDVTLSPVMGNYLSMARNDKPNPATGTTPNENYAREVLQLFSIGLYKLNPDGTQKLDAGGAPVPTFDQNTIEGFAALFTGWTYPPLPGATATWYEPVNYNGTMVAFPAHHSTAAKTLLDGYVVPAGQSQEADLEAALDDIFRHPNVGPFIGRQLIQHLVTSDPSPGYVARVAAVFADNGRGVRGDLGAVVRAILTDREARGDRPSSVGHLREPALFIGSVLRGLGGKTDGVFPRNAAVAMGQPVYSPPTVFSFYPPSYVLPGSDLLAPEFGIDSATSVLARANFVNTLVMDGGAPPNPTVPGSIGTFIDLSQFAKPQSHAELLDRLNDRLMHGSLPSDAANEILYAVNGVTSTDPLAPARTAAYLILTSAQYQVER